jgi:hypothetical protein
MQAAWSRLSRGRGGASAIGWRAAAIIPTSTMPRPAAATSPATHTERRRTGATGYADPSGPRGVGSAIADLNDRSARIQEAMNSFLATIRAA